MGNRDEAMPETRKPVSDEEAAADQIRSVYEDGVAEINGRSYHFLSTTFRKRRAVFAYLSRIGGSTNLRSGDMSFLDDPEFQRIEKIINDMVTFEGDLLSRITPQHWEDHPEDYVMFIMTALPVVSYPFLLGAGTG